MRALIAVLMLGLMLASAGSRADLSGEILNINEGLAINGRDQGAMLSGTVYQPEIVTALYHLLDYQAAWTDRDYAQSMLDLLHSSELEGLTPADYHYDELLALQQAHADGWSDLDFIRAQFDVLLSDGLLLYARHLLEGKVDPAAHDSSWNYPRRQINQRTVAHTLAQAIAQKQVAQALEKLKPNSPFYLQMKSELAGYRRLAGTQSFTPLASDQVLRPGDSGSRVIALRQRLKQLSLLNAAVADTPYFDDAVETAVKQLQHSHAIDADGVVGKDSFAALNMSFATRADKLRLNMDRVRWINQGLADELIVVNIAGYELYYFRDAVLQWETPVMTGTINTRTPIFQARLQYLEFNPTWTVPRSIIARSLFAKFKANPAYARDKGYQFYNSAGQLTASANIDWTRYNGRNFPYRVVQKPGPANAMGRVKFMFPNRHAVYLHDTPSRALFSRTARSFSAGCIRVKDPLELARVLLDDPASWSAGKIDALIASGAPKQVVHLQREIDVMLMYWTVSPGTDHQIQFHPDVYQLDGPTLADLNRTPTVVYFGAS